MYHITRKRPIRVRGVGRERRTKVAAHGSGKMAMPAAEQKKDFASEGFLGPERSGESLSFARQRRIFFDREPRKR